MDGGGGDGEGRRERGPVPCHKEQHDKALAGPAGNARRAEHLEPQHAEKLPFREVSCIRLGLSSTQPSSSCEPRQGVLLRTPKAHTKMAGLPPVDSHPTELQIKHGFMSRMEIVSSSIGLGQAAECALESSGAGFGSHRIGRELVLGPPLALVSGFNFLHPQNKDNNIYCWMPASPPPRPVLILQAWKKMKVSDGKALGRLLLTFSAQSSSGEQVPAFQGTSPPGSNAKNVTERF